MSELEIFLSPPDVGAAETSAVLAALESGWVAPVGPELASFERDLCEFTGAAHAVALSSGTAGLQLGLQAVGVKPDDSVICPTSTFAATAFSICHSRAVPIFVDAEIDTWNLDPQLLSAALDDLADQNQLPAAIVTVDLFGRTCDYDAILPIAQRYEIPVVVDAAEALGASYKGQAAGTQGALGVFSFNGNKIVTTSGGGAVVSDDPALIEKIRHWSAQSREDFPWYEHKEIGYNHRMSNVLAALGRAQLARLPEIIGRRRQIHAWYGENFSDEAGVKVVGDPQWGESNYWITNVMFTDPTGDDATLVREALAGQGVESRPAWKPMHQQPVFADARSYLNGTSDQIFAQGLCLPTGNKLSRQDINRISAIVLESIRQ